MLNRDRLECMRGRKVIVMPDCDAVEEWHEKLSTMQDIATFVISDMVEEFRKIGDKADVGDWVVAKHSVLREVKSILSAAISSSFALTKGSSLIKCSYPSDKEHSVREIAEA